MPATARQKNITTRRAGTAKGSGKSASHARSRPASRIRRALGRHVAGDAQDLRDEVGQLVQDIENRLGRLNSLTRRGASHAMDGMHDLAYGAVAGLSDRVRKSARGVGGEAAAIGSGAFNRVVHEIEKRPLLTLAIAVGLGIAAGFARRSD
jgi:hypothetical protein